MLAASSVSASSTRRSLTASGCAVENRTHDLVGAVGHNYRAVGRPADPVVYLLLGGRGAVEHIPYSIRGEGLGCVNSLPESELRMF